MRCSVVPESIVADIASSPLSEAPDYVLEAGASIVQPFMSSPALSSPAEVALAIAGANLLFVAASAASNVVKALLGRSGPIGAPYPPDAQAYDPVAADQFYMARLPVVVGRLLQLAALTGAFNVKLVFDLLLYKRAGSPEGEPWPNEAARAKEALSLATQLGPTFIKLAQALSIRTDLIPEAYALELRQLQDAVPAFDSAQAKEILARELQVPGGVGGLTAVFDKLSAEPLAAASIGQVYKGVLRDGRTVAVKVQRPSILDEIALDLYLLRLLTPLQTRVSNAAKNIPTYADDIKLATDLVDEWGRGFVAETDYKYEAENTKAFAEAMKRRGLGAVTSPTVVDEYSTKCVLVTEWVDGTRLDLDASPDVPRLCGVAINAYLTMLLDTGVLHCDPHPGNLLRTTGGQLCILDWGMTLEVPSDLQYSLIEFIAHVNAEDYEAMPQDFVNLGFTPEDQLERVRSSNLTEGLSFVLRQLSQGGGGKKVTERVRAEMREKYDPDGELTLDEIRQKGREEFLEQARESLAAEGEDVSVMDVQNVMEKMQQRNREMFRVPPYILYVARAFSTLEGIGLSANDDYSIVSEAYPYLSKRLLTDDSPRAKAALRSMLYGAEGKDASNATPDLTKMLSMGEGFASYSTATSAVPKGAAAASPPTATKAAKAPAKAAKAPAKAAKASGAAASSATAAAAASSGDPRAASTAANSATDELVDLLLSADGNYVQELLLEEAAKLADAAVRDSISSAGTSAPVNALKDALRAPKSFADATLDRLPLPGFLKSNPLLDAALLPAKLLDDVSRLLPTIARTNQRDAEALKAFNDLWEQLSPRILGDNATAASAADRVAADGSSQGGDGSAAGGSPSIGETEGRPSLELPPVVTSVQESAGPLLEQLADPDSRLRHRLPLLGTLTRRFGATLLRRVASRLEEDAALPDAPELVRTVAERAAEVDRTLAEMLEPDAPGAAAAVDEAQQEKEQPVG